VPQAAKNKVRVAGPNNARPWANHWRLNLKKVPTPATKNVGGGKKFGLKVRFTLNFHTLFMDLAKSFHGKDFFTIAPQYRDYGSQAFSCLIRILSGKGQGIGGRARRNDH
jgi:hypothetical protein